MSNSNLQGRVAVIAGGASGIGREWALTLAKIGVSVVVGDFDDKAGNQLIEDDRNMQNSGSILYKRFDASADDCKRLVKLALDTFGRVDILCNIIGVILEKITTVPEKDFEKEIKSYFDIINWMSNQVVQTMTFKKAGLIVNNFCLSGIRGIENNELRSKIQTSCAKYIKDITNSLSKDLNSSFIKVSGIAELESSPYIKVIGVIELDRADAHYELIEKESGISDYQKKSYLENKEEILQMIAAISSVNSNVTNHLYIYDVSIMPRKVTIKRSVSSTGFEN